MQFVELRAQGGGARLVCRRASRCRRTLRAPNDDAGVGAEPCPVQTSDWRSAGGRSGRGGTTGASSRRPAVRGRRRILQATARLDLRDRKSTRLNSSHANISYAVFCLKKKQ